MKTDSHKKVERFWDRMANDYDREEKKDERIYLQIIEKTRAFLKPTDRVLDFGCGTGLVSNEISKYVTKIHAIDISSKMIGNAKYKAEKRNIRNIEYTHATIFDESLETGSFNVILAFYILHLIEDSQVVMKRMHELLKPGGLLISATPCMGERPFLNGALGVLSKMGIVPKVKSFKIPDLEYLMAKGGFDVVEKECLPKTSNQYFMVAKKQLKNNLWIQ